LHPLKTFETETFCAAAAAAAMAVRAAFAWAKLRFSSSASCWRLDFARLFCKNIKSILNIYFVCL